MSPKAAQLVSSQGSEVKMTSYEELGKTVFEGFLNRQTRRESAN